MRAALVVARPPFLHLLPPDGAPVAFELARHGPVPPDLRAALARASADGPVALCGPELRRRLAGAVGPGARGATGAEWRRALEALPPVPPAEERVQFLEAAREDLATALRSPSEVLVSLAREEERLERAVGREARAAEAFVAVPGTPLADYAERWRKARGPAVEQLEQLRGALDEEARRSLPNLSALVGPRVAARLASAAGGLGPLGRMSASRLQLLGSRRRPSPERGPRYGVLYRTDALADVPPDRRGALARSVAALAVIAARADVLTHADVRPTLLARLRARRERLHRGRA